MPDNSPLGPKSAGSTQTPPSRAERAKTRWQTEPRMPAPASPPPSAAPRLNVSVLILYLLVTISLLLNGGLIWLLLRVQDRVFDSFDQFTTMAEKIEAEVLSVPIHVDETFPVSVSVPFEYSDTFPVNTTVPISTTLVVPFEIMGSTINIDVPVDMSVPINLDVPVSLVKTFDISTTVPVKFDMVVEIRMNDTPIPVYLTDLKEMLQGFKTLP